MQPSHSFNQINSRLQRFWIKNFVKFSCIFLNICLPPVPTPPKKKKKDEGMRTHLSGCARCEGYYKIDDREKAVYNHGAISSLDNDGEDPANKVKTTAQSNREARSNQRRLLTSFGEADFTSDLLKFNQLKVND
ncbi:hypothetical protein AVEN_183252-1 [Araneus ventricosus]|uniref:COMPASS complex Set1 subunit N-SET domain-containing protein n=1 Tax=Araneus ventricosus TaxID=182803 RepID=A0A4Y2MWM0_ARAVE|nr:hypothetical protein AVEN_183252-1 [Araneus ventricosus]